jgi:hypothetical protein
MKNVIAAVGEDDLLARALPLGACGNEIFARVKERQRLSSTSDNVYYVNYSGQVHPRKFNIVV